MIYIYGKHIASYVCIVKRFSLRHECNNLIKQLFCKLIKTTTVSMYVYTYYETVLYTIASYSVSCSYC